MGGKPLGYLYSATSLRNPFVAKWRIWIRDLHDFKSSTLALESNVLKHPAIPPPPHPPTPSSHPKSLFLPPLRRWTSPLFFPVWYPVIEDMTCKCLCETGDILLHQLSTSVRRKMDEFVEMMPPCTQVMSVVVVRTMLLILGVSHCKMLSICCKRKIKSCH